MESGTEGKGIPYRTVFDVKRTRGSLVARLFCATVAASLLHLVEQVLAACQVRSFGASGCDQTVSPLSAEITRSC